MIVFKILLKIWEVTVFILGNIYLLSIFINIILKIINSVRSKKLAKETADKIHESNFLQETFKPMTDKEKERMVKDGKSETKIKYDLKKNKVETSDDLVSFEDCVMRHVQKAETNTKFFLMTANPDTTLNIVHEFIKDSSGKYYDALYTKYQFCKVNDINNDFNNGVALLIDTTKEYVPYD